MTRPDTFCAGRHRGRLISLLVLSLAMAGPATAETLRKPALESLIATHKSGAPASLVAFLTSPAKAGASVAPAVASWPGGAPPGGAHPG